MGEVLPRNAQFAGRTLHTDRQHHVFGGNDLSSKDDLKSRRRSLYRGDLTLFEVNSVILDRVVPTLEHQLASACRKRHRRHERQAGRLRHNVFAELVIKDGVPDLTLFDENMAYFVVGGVRCGTEPRGPCSDNRYLKLLAHGGQELPIKGPYDGPH